MKPPRSSRCRSPTPGAGLRGRGAARPRPPAGGPRRGRPGCTMAQLLDAARAVSGAPLSADAVHYASASAIAPAAYRPLRCSSARPPTERSPSCSRRTRTAGRGTVPRPRSGPTTTRRPSCPTPPPARERRGATMVSVACSSGPRRSRRRRAPQRPAAARGRAGVRLGRTATATRLVVRTELEPLGPVQRGRLLAIRDLVDPGELLDPARIEALVTAAGDVAALDTDLALALLWRAGSRCWWGGAPPELRLPVAAAAERLAPRERRRAGAGDPRLRGPDRARHRCPGAHGRRSRGRRDAAPPRRDRAGPRRLRRELAPLGNGPRSSTASAGCSACSRGC